jgi:hypothetical protein
MQNISGSIGYDIWTIRTDISKHNNTVIQNKLIKKTSNELYMQVSGRIFIPLSEQIGNTMFEQTKDEVYNRLFLI